MRLRFVHGWGFDARIWQALVALLPYETQQADRGYFGEASVPIDDAPTLVVAHSFGAMLALREPPRHCLGLVAINGFDCFTARGDAPGVTARVMTRMIARFAEQPGQVLSEFRKRCGDEDAAADLDTGRLAGDLAALAEWDCRSTAARFAAPILSVQGGEDPILPARMRDAVFASAPAVHRVTHPSAGHLLPQTDPGFCAEQIRAFVERMA